MLPLLKFYIFINALCRINNIFTFCKCFNFKIQQNKRFRTENKLKDL